MKKQAIVMGIFALVLLGALIGCSKESQTDKNTGIANPASVNCQENGGTLEIRTGADGGQVGYCKFSNGKECEEWAFYRGNCTK